LRQREKNGWLKELSIWAFGLALGMSCVNCGTSPPRPQSPPSSSSRVEMPPTPNERSVVAPKTIDTPRSPAPAIQPSPPAPPPATEAPQTKEDFYVHTVKWNGETLSIIAIWYTGDGKNWKPLTEANPEINPNVIYEGDNILIPESLMKTKEPLPKTFVDRFQQKTSKEKVRSKVQPAPPQKEELNLFGPKKN
jgi:hypothetical protein